MWPSFRIQLSGFMRQHQKYLRNHPTPPWPGEGGEDATQASARVGGQVGGPPPAQTSIGFVGAGAWGRLPTWALASPHENREFGL